MKKIKQIGAFFLFALGTGFAVILGLGHWIKGTGKWKEGGHDE